MKLFPLVAFSLFGLRLFSVDLSSVKVFGKVFDALEICLK
jgi:hypothetical protein